MAKRASLGITPAHAGKSHRLHLSIHRPWDHPRTCGEKTFLEQTGPAGLGSPPHMRGKANTGTDTASEARITPAHAGKSMMQSRTATAIRDHPRTCGEKWCLHLRCSLYTGSPPHMRGKASSVLTGFCGTRITPAHAGKRLKRSRSTVPHAAIVPLFPSVCNKPAGSDGSPAGHDAPPFLPIENAAPASPAYNLRSL